MSAVIQRLARQGSAHALVHRGGAPIAAGVHSACGCPSPQSLVFVLAHRFSPQRRSIENAVRAFLFNAKPSNVLKVYYNFLY
jgi:hypothetical protein